MRLYMPQKHEIYVFLQFLESFRGKMYKNIFYRKWIEEWIQSETARITSDYALRTLSILWALLQKKQMRPEKTSNTVIFL